MANNVRIRDQLQRNAVALISLVIAITSLGYNTWRNEASEYNRNQRLISIEVLRNVGELQQVIFHNVWEMDTEDKGNPSTGWVYVLAIKDLTQLLDGAAAESGIDLWKVWDENWSDLKPENAPYQRVSGALEALRADTHALLRNLD
ncbi:MAG: hypothetical protein ACR2RD_05970 [Woeseiaceae bacterium]